MVRGACANGRSPNAKRSKTTLKRERVKSGYRETLTHKVERYDGLRALLEEWEPTESENIAYVGSLRRKLYKLKIQLRNMGV